MWQGNFLIIVYVTLGLFCLEIILKANSAPEMSKAAKNFGRLVIVSGKKLISNKNKETLSTKPQAVLEDTDGYQSYQPALTGNNGCAIIYSRAYCVLDTYLFFVTEYILHVSMA